MIYLIKINFKSGNSEEFWTSEYSYDKIKDSFHAKFPQTLHTYSQKPVYINLDEVEFISQIDKREVDESN